MLLRKASDGSGLQTLVAAQHFPRFCITELPGAYGAYGRYRPDRQRAEWHLAALGVCAPSSLARSGRTRLNAQYGCGFPNPAARCARFGSQRADSRSSEAVHVGTGVCSDSEARHKAPRTFASFSGLEDCFQKTNSTKLGLNASIVRSRDRHNDHRESRASRKR